MTAPGLYTSVKVEIQFIPGQWTDVSGDVALELGVHIQQGRADEFSDVSPGQLDFVLRNDTGKYTPNNPTSVYFPYVTEGRPVRASVIRSATTYRRFTGTTAALDPSFPTDDSSTGIVKVSAIDVLGSMANRTMQTGFTEEAVRQAKLKAGWADVYTMQMVPRSSSRAPIYLTNFGVVQTLGNPLGTAKFLAPGHGSAAINAADQLIVDNQMDIKPRAKYAVGPILRCIVGTAVTGTTPGIGQVEFWCKIPSTFVSGNQTYYIAHFWQTIGVAGGNKEWFSIRLYESADTTMHVGVYDATGAKILDLLDADNTTVNYVNDNQWRKYVVWWQSGSSTTYFNVNDGLNVGSASFNLSVVDRIYFGGGSKPQHETGDFWVPECSIAGIDIQGPSVTGVWKYYSDGEVSLIDTETRLFELLGYCDALVTQRYVTGTTYTAASPTVTTSVAMFSSDDQGAGIGANTLDIPANAVISTVNSPTSITMSVNATVSGTTQLLVGPVQMGSDTRIVARVNTKDSQHMLEAFAVLARSVGGVVWADVNGRLTFIYADAMRPVTPLVSLDLEADIDASNLTLRRSIDTVPTRVTVSGPAGDIVYIDTATEAGLVTGQAYRKDFQISAGAQNDVDANAIGGYYATSSHGLRITKIDVDLTVTASDYYATFLTAGNLYPGQRLRGTNLPSTVFGVTQADVIVQGWKESYDDLSAVFSFDLTPADDPVEGTLDSAEYGRWAADKSLCLAYDLTNAVTTVRVAPNDNTAATFTTSAGDYALDIDVQGERITCPTVPTTLARTNLITNPSFDGGTTGWTGTSATLTQVTTPTIDDTQAMRAVWGTIGALGGSISWTAAGLTIGHTYAFSAYVYVPAGSPRVKIVDLSGTMTSVSFTRQDTTGFNGAYVRLGMVATASAVSHAIGFRNVDAATSGQVAFFDAILLEDTALGVGSYFDGNTNSGAWTGGVGASTSTQTAQVFTGVTRGVSPAVARAHTAGEITDAYHSMTWTF